ncbi:MAG: YicC/YloC family endoribonuclease [Phyllobacterium sp.]
MPLQGMTGFARYSTQHANSNIVWEIKSVNGKGLDCRFRLPSGFESIELPARKLLAERFKRGNFQASLTVEQAVRQSSLVVNEALLNDLVRIAARLREEHGLAPSTAEGFLSLRGVLEAPQEAQDAEEQTVLEADVLMAFEEALRAVQEHRSDEGRSLGHLLSGYIDTMEALVLQARNDPQRSPEAVRSRLAAQISLLMDASGNLDETRLHAEAALLATRADIQEELDRLDFHVASARALLKDGGAVGRKLDFLSQEFNREANTLCSKSNAPSVTTVGLELKAAVDQFREQVQNLE